MFPARPPAPVNEEEDLVRELLQEQGGGGGGGGGGEVVPFREQSSLSGHIGAVLCVRWNPHGTYCMSGGKDATVRLWNPHTSTSVKTYKGHGYEVYDVAISEDNSKFGSVGGDKMVFLWDVATGQTIRKLKGHDQRINAVSFGADYTVLVTGSYDATVKIWDCRSRSTDPVDSMRDAKDSVTAVAVNGTNIFTSSVDGCVRTYDVRIGKCTTDDLSNPITSLSISHDSNCILASCLDNCVRLLDRESGELLNEYSSHVHSSFKVESCLTRTDAFVVSGSEDGRIFYWELVEAKLVKSFQGHQGCVNSCHFHPRKDLLLTASTDGTIKLWR